MMIGRAVRVKSTLTTNKVKKKRVRKEVMETIKIRMKSTYIPLFFHFC